MIPPFRKSILSSLISLVGVFALSWVSSAQAYFYVPIAGIDQASSQYICKQQAGLTSTIQEVKPGGVLLERSTGSVVKSLSKQIAGVQAKILTVNSGMSKVAGAKLAKLKQRKVELLAQVKSLKFIRTQVGNCAKSKLLFSASSSPMFLSATFPDPRPGYTGNLSGYLFGFIFTPPKNWNGDYCAVVSGASTGVTSLPTTKYTDFAEQGAYIRSNCISLGGVPFCAPGFEPGQLMVVLAQGIIGEAPGTCGSKPWLCSITEVSTVLTSNLGGAFLHSLRPQVGNCGG